MKPEYVHLVFERAPDCRKGPGLSIMSFVTKSFNPDGSVEFEREPTKENVEAEIAKGGFKFTRWRFISAEEIPQDRTFRNAWIDQGWSIGHDMKKCREIHRDSLRKRRQSLLEKLDVDALRATEDGDQDKLKTVRLSKQKLRDITADPRIESASTPEELLLVTLP